MVICVVIGCSACSERDKWLTFHRFPMLTKRFGEKDFELRKKRLDGYLAAISREDIDPKSIEEHDYRICSRHFVLGKPAKLYETNSPNWLSTLHLGHTKQSAQTSVTVERYERFTERYRRKELLEDLMKEALVVVTQLVDEVVSDESKLLATEELKIGKEYIKAGVSKENQAECDCASKVESLQKGLVSYKLAVEQLTKQLNDLYLPPFCEKHFISDEYTKFHTGLPNFKLVKAIFDHVSKGLPTDGVTKLSNCQEFMCMMLKLRTCAPNEGLAYQFGVSEATVSRIILKWLKLTNTRLAGLIHWPDRDALQKTMPNCFRVSFGRRVAVIIDCFEIFIERPSNLLARAAT